MFPFPFRDEVSHCSRVTCDVAVLVWLNSTFLQNWDKYTLKWILSSLVKVTELMWYNIHMKVIINDFSYDFFSYSVSLRSRFISGTDNKFQFTVTE